MDGWGNPVQLSRYKSINQSLSSYQQTYSVLNSKHKNSDSHNALKRHLISEDIISSLEINELLLITENREVLSVANVYISVIVYTLGMCHVVVRLTFKTLPVTWCTNSLTFNNCTFCPHCICVFCTYLRTNSDLCHLQHKLIGFYNRDEKCLLRGTNWVFK